MHAGHETVCTDCGLVLISTEYLRTLGNLVTPNEYLRRCQLGWAESDAWHERQTAYYKGEMERVLGAKCVAPGCKNLPYLHSGGLCLEHRQEYRRGLARDRQRRHREHQRREQQV